MIFLSDYRPVQPTWRKGQSTDQTLLGQRGTAIRGDFQQPLSQVARYLSETNGVWNFM